MSLPANTEIKELYADIIVDISHEAVDRTFAYKVPSALKGQIGPGSRVRVPFGAGDRQIEGYVTALNEEPGYDPDKLKEIIDLVPGSISVESQLIQVADFLRLQYGSTMIQALKTVLPVKRLVDRRKKAAVVTLAITDPEGRDLLSTWKQKKYKARARLLERLLQEGQMDTGIAVRECGVPRKDLIKLADQGILKISEPEDEGLSAESISIRQGAALNAGQQKIADAFRKAHEAGIRKTWLLYGVTGSGKTEVYLALIEIILKEGKQAIVLIPEISLTYQTVSRFSARFKDQVAVIHSRMSAGERSAEVERIRSGRANVVIGARSALFAPVSKLGIIIIDEEHDGAYKSDASPKYHARETAIYRAGLAGAHVVLGSATPSVESYARARDGLYGLWVLKNRAGAGRLPHVRVVDMREEFRSGNRSVFSRELSDLIRDRLDRKEQVMLFLNRRGYAGFVSCRSCGHVIKCPHCDVSLTYHRDGSLRCHYCGFRTAYETRCPACGSAHVAVFGLGTEKAEAALQREFPGARILRMDADTTRRRHAHENILGAFSRGEADILLGTQMIVKGHDYANVTLMGILAADLSLNSADFRSSEKTFQLLCQAAGRAGRGDKPGEVLIQTYDPDHYAVTAAARHSYESFFEQEYAYRSLMKYPPCAHILVILIQSSDERQAVIAAMRIQRIIEQSWKDQADPPVILNPGAAAVSKIKDIYRQILYLKHQKGEVLKDLRMRLEPVLLEHPMFAGISVQFDYDPMNRY